jgi:hypothetical protein
MGTRHSSSNSSSWCSTHSSRAQLSYSSASPPPVLCPIHTHMDGDKAQQHQQQLLVQHTQQQGSAVRHWTACHFGHNVSRSSSERLAAAAIGSARGSCCLWGHKLTEAAAAAAAAWAACGSCCLWGHKLAEAAAAAAAAATGCACGSWCAWEPAVVVPASRRRRRSSSSRRRSSSCVPYSPTSQPPPLAGGANSLWQQQQQR